MLLHRGFVLCLYACAFTGLQRRSSGKAFLSVLLFPRLRWSSGLTLRNALSRVASCARVVTDKSLANPAFVPGYPSRRAARNVASCVRAVTCDRIAKWSRVVCPFRQSRCSLVIDGKEGRRPRNEMKNRRGALLPHSQEIKVSVSVFSLSLVQRVGDEFSHSWKIPYALLSAIPYSSVRFDFTVKVP